MNPSSAVHRGAGPVLRAALRRRAAARLAPGLALLLAVGVAFGLPDGAALCQPAVSVGPAPAQVAPVAPTPSFKEIVAVVSAADDDLHDLSKSFGEARLGNAEAAQKIAAVAPIEARLDDAAAQLAPRLAALDARLAQLGPPPGPAQPAESPQIRGERRLLLSQRQAVDAELKQARLLAVEAAQIADTLASRQRREISAELWGRSRSILDPRLWRDFAGALPADIQRVTTALNDQAATVGKAARAQSVVFGWSLAAAAALVIALPLRLWLSRVLAARIAAASPKTRLRRTILALGRVAMAIIAPLIGLTLVRTVLESTGAITPLFEQVAPLVIRTVVLAAFFEGLGRALLSPDAPGWRLAPLSDSVVGRLQLFPGLIGIAAALATFARGMTVVLGASSPTAIASDGLTVFIELLAVGGALLALGRARQDQIAEAAQAVHSGESRLPWVLSALFAWVVLGVSAVAAVLGYVSLAAMLMGEMIWVATVLASLFLLLRLADDVFPVVLAAERPLGGFLRTAIGLSGRALEQVSVLLSGVTRLLLLLFGWAAILAPFGTGAGDVFVRITTSQLVIRIGQVSISPGAVAGAIVVFLAGLILTRVIRQWLERSYLPKTTIDIGVQTSMAAGVSYLGAALAVLLGFGYLGLSFDRIALFASALSVGVGFGLQAVIGNFVSGLILLAERPVRVGDWIAIGDLEGDVKKINVRATEIEMQDRSKLIVPNSDLISKTVRNVTHAGSLGRIKIVIKTTDAADPAVVRDLLLARLKGHPEVRVEPQPSVYLTSVGDGALEFTAFAYVDSPRMAYRARSEILFQIVPELRACGVDLARSGPVVSLSLADRVIEPSAGGQA